MLYLLSSVSSVSFKHTCVASI